MQIVDPDRIRDHRTARRYTLRLLAQMCGRNSHGKKMCSYQAIANWENGVTKTIPEETAARLSQILEFPLLSVFRPMDGPAVPKLSTRVHSNAQVAS